MKKGTRFMGALLALIFVFALLPVSAFAAEPAVIEVTDDAEALPIPEVQEGTDGQTTPEGNTDPAPKPEFVATSDSEGTLKNVGGMEWKVGKDGTYKAVAADKTEVTVGREDGLNAKDPSFQIFVKKAGAADTEAVEIKVGRMPGPGTFIKEKVQPTSGKNDGKIVFKEKVNMELGHDGTVQNFYDVEEITGLGLGEHFLRTLPKGSNLASSIHSGDGVLNVIFGVKVKFAPGEHGEGQMDDISASANSTIDAPECKFTPVNTDKVKYEFDGWETDEFAEKTEDGKYLIKDTTVFTAKWKEVKEPVMVDVTLTFDYNDGSGKTSSETKTVESGSNAEFTLPEAPYQRDEHDFAGWEIAGTVFKAGDKVYNSVDATAKAVWKEREALHYVLRFDANGGTGAPEAQDMGMSKHREVRLTVTDKVPTKDGMKFLGWSLHKGTEVVLKPGDVCLLNEKFPDLTVYAVWVDPAAAPQTGDESNIGLWAGIAAVSLVVVAGVVFFILKKNKKKDEDDVDTQE